MIGNYKDIFNYLEKLAIKLEINIIDDPINWKNYKKNHINLYDVSNISNKKYKNLINQINISNFLSLKTNNDLVTMPIDKSIFKKKFKFIGMTEYLGSINKKKTTMLMVGNLFSVIPLTTHINLNDIKKHIKTDILNEMLNSIFSNLKREIYGLKFSQFKFLCYNPHCGENNTIGKEDKIIKDSLKNFNKIKGLYPADSAFIKIDKNTLYISMYHDQVLIPFKLLNKESVNLTLGLNYKRLSPAHGTARDIKFKNKADNTSYIRCMLF